MPLTPHAYGSLASAWRCRIVRPSYIRSSAVLLHARCRGVSCNTAIQCRIHSNVGLVVNGYFTASINNASTANCACVCTRVHRLHHRHLPTLPAACNRRRFTALTSDFLYCGNEHSLVIIILV